MTSDYGHSAHIRSQHKPSGEVGDANNLPGITLWQTRGSQHQQLHRHLKPPRLQDPLNADYALNRLYFGFDGFYNSGAGAQVRPSLSHDDVKYGGSHPPLNDVHPSYYAPHASLSAPHHLNRDYFDLYMRRDPTTHNLYYPLPPRHQSLQPPVYPFQGSHPGSLPSFTARRTQRHYEYQEASRDALQLHRYSDQYTNEVAEFPVRHNLHAYGIATRELRPDTRIGHQDMATVTALSPTPPNMLPRHEHLPRKRKAPTPNMQSIHGSDTYADQPSVKRSRQEPDAVLNANGQGGARYSENRGNCLTNGDRKIAKSSQLTHIDQPGPNGHSLPPWNSTMLDRRDHKRSSQPLLPGHLGSADGINGGGKLIRTPSTQNALASPADSMKLRTYSKAGSRPRTPQLGHQAGAPPAPALGPASSPPNYFSPSEAGSTNPVKNGVLRPIKDDAGTSSHAHNETDKAFATRFQIANVDSDDEAETFEFFLVPRRTTKPQTPGSGPKETSLHTDKSKSTAGRTDKPNSTKRTSVDQGAVRTNGSSKPTAPSPNKTSKNSAERLEAKSAASPAQKRVATGISTGSTSRQKDQIKSPSGAIETAATLTIPCTPSSPRATKAPAMKELQALSTPVNAMPPPLQGSANGINYRDLLGSACSKVMATPTQDASQDFNIRHLLGSAQSSDSRQSPGSIEAHSSLTLGKQGWSEDFSRFLEGREWHRGSDSSGAPTSTPISSNVRDKSVITVPDTQSTRDKSVITIGDSQPPAEKSVITIGDSESSSTSAAIPNGPKSQPGVATKPATLEAPPSQNEGEVTGEDDVVCLGDNRTGHYSKADLINVEPIIISTDEQKDAAQETLDDNNHRGQHESSHAAIGKSLPASVMPTEVQHVDHASTADQGPTVKGRYRPAETGPPSDIRCMPPPRKLNSTAETQQPLPSTQPMTSTSAEVAVTARPPSGTKQLSIGGRWTTPKTPALSDERGMFSQQQMTPSNLLNAEQVGAFKQMPKSKPAPTKSRRSRSASRGRASTPQHESGIEDPDIAEGWDSLRRMERDVEAKEKERKKEVELAKMQKEKARLEKRDEKASKPARARSKSIDPKPAIVNGGAKSKPSKPSASGSGATLEQRAKTAKATAQGKREQAHSSSKTGKDLYQALNEFQPVDGAGDSAVMATAEPASRLPFEARRPSSTSKAPLVAPRPRRATPAAPGARNAPVTPPNRPQTAPQLFRGTPQQCAQEDRFHQELFNSPSSNSELNAKLSDYYEAMFLQRQAERPPNSKKYKFAAVNPTTLLPEDLLLMRIRSEGRTWAEVHSEWKMRSGRSMTEKSLMHRYAKLVTTINEYLLPGQGVPTAPRRDYRNHSRHRDDSREVLEMDDNGNLVPDPNEKASNANDRSTTGGKTIGLDWWENNVNIYSPSPSPEPELLLATRALRGPSPFNERDKTHNVYRVNLLKASLEDDLENAEEICVGKSTTSLAQANQNACTVFLAQQKIAPYDRHSSWSNDGKVVWEGTSIVENIQVRVYVAASLSTFMDDKMPENKEGWVAKTCWVVVEQQVIFEVVEDQPMQQTVGGFDFQDLLNGDAEEGAGWDGLDDDFHDLFNDEQVSAEDIKQTIPHQLATTLPAHGDEEPPLELPQLGDAQPNEEEVVPESRPSMAGKRLPGSMPDVKIYQPTQDSLADDAPTLPDTDQTTLELPPTMAGKSLLGQSVSVPPTMSPAPPSITRTTRPTISTRKETRTDCFTALVMANNEASQYCASVQARIAKQHPGVELDIQEEAERQAWLGVLEHEGEMFQKSFEFVGPDGKGESWKVWVEETNLRGPRNV